MQAFWTKATFVVSLTILCGQSSVLANLAEQQPLQPASPKQAIFYPSEVQLEVEEALLSVPLPDGGVGFRLVLPANVDKESFFAVIDGRPVSAIMWEKTETAVPANDAVDRQTLFPFAAVEAKGSPKRMSIVERIEIAQNAISEARGQIASTQTTLEMWEAVLDPRNLSNAQDRQKIVQEMAASIPALHVTNDKAVQKRMLAELELNRALAELADFDAQYSFTKVYLLVTSQTEQPVTVRYGYILPATFKSSYNVYAKPVDKTVSIEQIANLEQSSGFTWEGVDVLLSTTARNKRINPLTLNPWWLRVFEKEKQFSGNMKAMAPAPQQVMEMAMSADVSAGQEPEAEELSTFRMWKLGKKSLASGVPNRVVLSTSVSKANFFYTLRPAIDPKGYLTADIVFAETVEMPRGKASVFVDGVGIGDISLDLEGKNATLYFGADPLVTATMTRKERVTGEQGLISKDQTHLWDWEIVARNARGRLVDLRVEDALPVALDKSIALKIVAVPEAEHVGPALGQEAWLARWSFALEAGAEKTIQYRVDAVAPASSDLDIGR